MYIAMCKAIVIDSMAISFLALQGGSEKGCMIQVPHDTWDTALPPVTARVDNNAIKISSSNTS